MMACAQTLRRGLVHWLWIPAIKSKGLVKCWDLKLYLFTFDPTIPAHYERLGWKTIGMDEFKPHPVTVMEAS